MNPNAMIAQHNSEVLATIARLPDVEPQELIDRIVAGEVQMPVWKQVGIATLVLEATDGKVLAAVYAGFVWFERFLQFVLDKWTVKVPGMPARTLQEGPFVADAQRLAEGLLGLPECEEVE